LTGAAHIRRALSCIVPQTQAGIKSTGAENHSYVYLYGVAICANGNYPYTRRLAISFLTSQHKPHKTLTPTGGSEDATKLD
jgi:hypothetical protein